MVFVPCAPPSQPYESQCCAQIKKHALSGGQETVEKHRELGANIEVDVAYQYLSFFLEDDAELERVTTHALARRRAPTHQSLTSFSLSAARADWHRVQSWPHVDG